jgi:hypothetical protein
MTLPFAEPSAHYHLSADIASWKASAIDGLLMNVMRSAKGILRPEFARRGFNRNSGEALEIRESKDSLE